MDNQEKSTPKWTLTGCHVCIGTEESFDPCGKDYNEVKARASLIVKAVNNHEALFEACKRAEQVLGSYQAPVLKALHSIMSQAIAKAEGR